MTHQQIAKKISKELDIPEEVILCAYRLYWKGIKEMWEKFDFNTMTDSEIDNARTSINVNMLGKFYTNSQKIKKVKARKLIMLNYKN